MDYKYKYYKYKQKYLDLKNMIGSAVPDQKTFDSNYISNAIIKCGYLTEITLQKDIHRIKQNNYLLYLDNKLVNLNKGHVVHKDHRYEILVDIELIYNPKTKNVTYEIYYGSLNNDVQNMINIFNCVMNKLNE